MRLRSAVSSSIVFFSFLAANTLLSATNVPAGTINTDTTWDLSGSPFLVACGGVTVASGATLTISPGVVVKFEGAGCPGSSLLGLSINGGLVANGTSTQPITFSSLTDDTNSGWHGIFFNSGAGGSISNAVLRFGGFPFSSAVQAMVYIATGNALVSITNNTIGYSFTNAVFVTGGGTSPTISNNTFSVNSLGINVQEFAAPAITNNTFVTTGVGEAISIDMNVRGVLTGNLSSGTGLNAVHVRPSATFGNAAWAETSMAYVLECGVFVGIGGSLTIAPGVALKFLKPIACSAAFLEVRGTLVANGTPTQPIYFTSLRDDQVGGDTNGDGSATTAAPGDWNGVVLGDPVAGGPGRASISHAEFRYGGSPPGFASGTVHIQTQNAEVSLSNSLITKILGSGVFIKGNGTSPTISNNTFSQNNLGIDVQEFAAPTMTNNTFVTTTGTRAISIDMNVRGVLTGNLSSGTGLNAVHVRPSATFGNAAWAETSMAYVLECGVFVGIGGSLTIAPGVALKFLKPVGCSAAFLEVRGMLVANGTAAQNIVFTSLNDDTFRGDTNGDGSATTPHAGDWNGLVLGDPVAGGPGSASISHTEFRYGGSPPGFASGMVHIQTQSADVSLSSSVITNSLASGIFIKGNGTSPSIRGNTISLNLTGLAVAAGATPHINFNNILGNPSYGVLNADCVSIPNTSPCPATPDVDATNNYWGNANGPSRDPDRPGLGDKVSFHVNFDQFKTQPGPQITVLPSPITFPVTQIGQTSTVPAKITNSGTGTLSITSITAMSPFAVGAFPNSIQAGTDGSFDVSFSPTAPASFSGELTIASDAVNAPTLKVPLQGVVQGTPDFTLEVVPSSRAIRQGETTAYKIALKSILGFSASVILSVSKFPENTMVSLINNPIVPTGAGTVSYVLLSTTQGDASNPATATPRGPFALDITGRSGQIVHTQRVGLDIVP